MNDILLKITSQHVTLLIVLDLSAAFDTVDHQIHLDRLSDVVGICETALHRTCLIEHSAFLSMRFFLVFLTGIAEYLKAHV